MMTDEEKDRKRWPLPEVAREAGITEDEWVSIAKKSWSDHFCGGEDGVLATAIGSFKWAKNRDNLRDKWAKMTGPQT